MSKFFFLTLLMILGSVFYPVSASVIFLPSMNEISSVLNIQGTGSAGIQTETLFSLLSSDEAVNKITTESPESFAYNDSAKIWSAYNRASDATISTNGSGSFLMENDEGLFWMKLSGFGRKSFLKVPEEGEIAVSKNCLNSIHEDFTEWYISNDDGIEHGMTVYDYQSGDGNLFANFLISGELKPFIAGDTVYLSNSKGAVFEYTGIEAWDSEGKSLEASLGLNGYTVIWEINDSDAVYPLTVDPTIKLVQTKYGQAGTDDGFGASVSISGDYAIVGGMGKHLGNIYFYKNDGFGNWVLTDIKSSPVSYFGCSVSISDDYAIVGEEGNNTPAANAGAAYFYKNDGSGNWLLTDIKNGAEEKDYFGSSVSISGDYAVVGAIKNTDLNRVGAAYFYKNDGSGNWVLTDIKNGAEECDHFGASVSISDDYAIVGAFANNSRSGAAYFYKNDGSGNWVLTETKEGLSESELGFSVSVDDDYAVVGGRGNGIAGTARFYKKNSLDKWEFAGQVNGASSGEEFGNSVSISGDYAVVGAYRNGTTAGYAGAAFVYYVNNQTPVFTKYGAEEEDFFGSSVSISGNYFIIGAYRYESYRGAAYIYKFRDIAFEMVSPATAVNSGSVSVAITGADFYGTPVVTLKKSGEADIPASGIILSGEREISCTFNITGASSGAWDIEIINPDGSSVTAVGVFTITLPGTHSGSGSSGGPNTDTGISLSINLKPGSTASFDMDKGSVYKVEMTAESNIKKVMITVQKKGSVPSSVETPGTDVYEYEDVNLYYADNSDLTLRTFFFKVSKHWLSSHGYDSGDIVMMHYNEDTGEWEELGTTLTDEDSAYYYYTATTPSFSWFAVAYSEGATIMPEITETPEMTQAPSETVLSTPKPSAEPSLSMSETPMAVALGDKSKFSLNLMVLPILLALLLICILGGVVIKKRKEKYPEWWDEKKK